MVITGRVHRNFEFYVRISEYNARIDAATECGSALLLYPLFIDFRRSRGFSRHRHRYR